MVRTARILSDLRTEGHKVLPGRNQRQRRKTNMATKYKAMRMNTGFGSFTYTIMMWDGASWKSSRPVRYYKTLRTANQAIERIKKR